jgi:hypothetical protein
MQFGSLDDPSANFTAIDISAHFNSIYLNNSRQRHHRKSVARFPSIHSLQILILDYSSDGFL